MYIKRSLILSSNNSNEKLLLIVEKSERIVAKIKGLNVESENLWAVFSFNDLPLTLHKLEINNNVGEIEFEPFYNVNDKIGCVLFSLDESVLFCGATESKELLKLEFLKSLSEFKKQIQFYDEKQKSESKNFEDCGDAKKQTIDDEISLFDSSQEEIDEEINSSLSNELLCECLSKSNEDKCKNCTYKKSFFKDKIKESVAESLSKPSKQLNEETIDENEMPNAEVPQKKKKKFFCAVENSLNEFFNTYEKDVTLEGLVENSKFVKVDYEGNGNYYSVGVIYDDNQDEKYICYAISGKKDVPPPQELDGFSQWLQVDGENGYWLMFQDAENGESQKVG